MDHETDGQHSQVPEMLPAQVPLSGPGPFLSATEASIGAANRPGGPGAFDGPGQWNPIGGANRPRIPFDLAAGRIIDHGQSLTSERFPMSRLRVEGSRSLVPPPHHQSPGPAWDRTVTPGSLADQYNRENSGEDPISLFYHYGYLY